MSDAPSLLSIDGQIATLTFNRPKSFNALTLEMRYLILEQIRQVELDKSVRVLIINANGKGFCAGADLMEGMAESTEDSILETFGPVITNLRKLDKVVIAAVNGVAAGIGAAVVTAADLAVIAEGAYMQMAFSKIAMLPDGGLTWDLVRSMGYKRAYRAMIEATNISAQELKDYGIVNEVVPAEELQQYVRNWAESITALSPIANKVTKRAMRMAMETSLEQAVLYEAAEQERASKSADHHEGVEAFKGKRKANFPGK
jgi:2-(1,2-epoxy-1,2-dihydrophenyl)acetyl-CoA isomerase